VRVHRRDELRSRRVLASRPFPRGSLLPPPLVDIELPHSRRGGEVGRSSLSHCCRKFARTTKRRSSASPTMRARPDNGAPLPGTCEDRGTSSRDSIAGSYSGSRGSIGLYSALKVCCPISSLLSSRSGTRTDSTAPLSQFPCDYGGRSNVTPSLRRSRPAAGRTTKGILRCSTISVLTIHTRLHIRRR